jgi:enoyl-CoA hydratase/carnithine racemase
VVGVEDPVAELRLIKGNVVRHLVAARMLDQVLRLGVEPATGGLQVESMAYSALLAGEDFAEWLAAAGPRGARPTPPDLVRSSRDGDELVITLNHPNRHNAYSAAMRDALIEALDVALVDSSIERVRLRGAGPSFCSGGELAEFGAAGDVALAHLIRTGHSAAAILDALVPRTAVELHGHCIGAGIELASFASYVTADPGTRFRLPELSMGLIPGAGGTVSIRRRIGRWRTAWLAFSGRELDVETALTWGLVDAVTQNDSPGGLSQA